MNVIAHPMFPCLERHLQSEFCQITPFALFMPPLEKKGYISILSQGLGSSGSVWVHFSDAKWFNPVVFPLCRRARQCCMLGAMATRGSACSLLSQKQIASCSHPNHLCFRNIFLPALRDYDEGLIHPGCGFAPEYGTKLGDEGILPSNKETACAVTAKQRALIAGLGMSTGCLTSWNRGWWG